MLGGAAVLLCLNHGTKPPKPLAEASPEEERVCDKWCASAFATFPNTPLPDEQIRPWILARYTAAVHHASQQQKEMAPSPGVWNQSLFKRLLVADWHDRHREQWAEIAKRNPVRQILVRDRNKV